MGIQLARWANLEQVRKTVRQLIQEKFPPHYDRCCRQHRPDTGTWKAAGPLSILLSHVPEEYGRERIFADETVVIEELAQSGVRFEFNVQSVVAHYILAYWNQEQKRK